MDLGLGGKVAVITGGSVGIGLAVARCLAAEGVHLAPRRPRRRAGRAGGRRHRRRARRPGPRRPGRPRDAEGCAAVIAAAESAFGGADILINNAGTGSNETILEAPDAKWQYYWDLHVMAAVRLARGLAPR